MIIYVTTKFNPILTIFTILQVHVPHTIQQLIALIIIDIKFMVNFKKNTKKSVFSTHNMHIFYT